MDIFVVHDGPMYRTYDNLADAIAEASPTAHITQTVWGR